jgi:tartrate-resistant acid phosphatase type 5
MRAPKPLSKQSIAFRRAIAFVFVLALSADAEKFYTYVDDLGPDYIELAWGTADGHNTIGRSAPSHGEATVRIAGRTLITRAGQITIGDLLPDHEYSYQVSIGGSAVGRGEVRTWAAKSQRLVFFVIGDFGTGRVPQYQIARAMWNEFQSRARTDNPVRFILSVGDNIYGSIAGFLGGAFHTGAHDVDWAPKFYAPYEPLIARIPFFPSLGNHDGNETERQADLPAILDNFAFPQNKPARYYDFTYGDLAKFFALDSTRNTESGPARAGYLEDSAQFQWMRTEFAKPHPLWVIPFFHHPPFTAGPLHNPSFEQLQHWVKLFGASGVKVVFNGHEHNFQVSEDNGRTSGICFIVSGAGGELRTGNPKSNMKRAGIRAWAAENHFLVAEIDGKTMRVTPVSFEPMKVVDGEGRPVTLPITITQP